jgi:hypothetical protein
MSYEYKNGVTLTSRMQEMASLIESNGSLRCPQKKLIPQDSRVFVNFILPFYLRMQKKGTIRIAQINVHIYIEHKKKKICFTWTFIDPN